MPSAKISILLLLLCLTPTISAEAAADQTISGNIVFDRGRFNCSACDIRLELTGSRRMAVAHADSGGSFMFWGVAPGSYVIRVLIDGIEEAQKQVEVNNAGSMSTSVTITVRQRLKYQVIDTSNSPVVDLSEFLQQYPKKAVEYYKRALEDRRRNQISDAIGNLEKAIEIAPKFYHARNDLGLLYKQEGRFEDAERQFVAAHEVNRSNADPLVNLTSLYIDTDHPEKAVTTGEEAVKKNRRSAPAFFNLGMALYKISRLDKAEAALKKALQLAPRMFQVRLMLANVYAKLRRYDNVIEQLDSYLAENPDGEKRKEVEEMREKLLTAREELK